MQNQEINTITLVSNTSQGDMYHEIYSSLANCKSFIFSVAFISFGGLQLLIKHLNDANIRGVPGKILTSDYQNFTDPKALRKLQQFTNIETKIFLQAHQGGFHTKAYVFDYENEIKLYIGSSNITESALLKNVEWNVKIISKREHPFVNEVMTAFEGLWERTQVIDERFLSEYESFIDSLREIQNAEERFVFRENTVQPNSMQVKAIANLNLLRQKGEDRALVIAATGTGKTYMSAFDAQQFSPNRLLFIVHREDILHRAAESFKRVLGDRLDTGILSGTRHNRTAKYLFATIQTLLNHYESFSPEEFDYIVIDESHHAMAEGYQRVLDHFKPKFLLGMTATPERMDGYGLFSYFKNNVALEVRLFDAIDQNLVCPFHYFGVVEAEGIDLSDLKDQQIDELAQRLSTHSRVEYILEQIELYGFAGKKLKALGFCASVKHAQFMAKEFNDRGIKSVVLSGEDDVEYRIRMINELENESDPLSVIFTRDVFNEGIDIPSLNMVLMLRPTNSPIIFIQQLGRGLRRIKNKEFVTVIDFIGNYKKSFMLAIALKGQRYYDKESLIISVRQGFKEIPGDSFVYMDEIARDEIVKQLSGENFQRMTYLKDDYFAFKAINKQQIPYRLMDYEYYEASPDPLKFVEKSGSYQDFLLGVETKDTELRAKWDGSSLKLIRYLQSMLSLKRPIEFMIIETLIKHQRLALSQLFSHIQNQHPEIDEGSIRHAINNLSGNYLIESEKKGHIEVFAFKDEVLYLGDSLRTAFEKGLYDEIIDTLKYGLLRFEREFGSFKYQVPFFGLYQTYSMRDVAQLCNLEKKFNSFRGSGLLRNLNDYFLFIDLHKDSDVKESINYKDKIISHQLMQWETPNSTSQDSKVGQNLINHRALHFSLHIFVRKYTEINKQVQPYIYLGEANLLKFDPTTNKPITMLLEFEVPLPDKIFRELTLDTRKDLGKLS
jgi:superfamily II DNA or RNA helicase/HKD family nuclease